LNEVNVNAKTLAKMAEELDKINKKFKS